MRVMESCIDSLEEEPTALAGELGSVRDAIARLTVIEELLALKEAGLSPELPPLEAEIRSFRGGPLETGEDFGPGGLSNL